MSVAVMALVWASDIRPNADRFVLLALADNANDGGYCRPGAAHLSGKTALSRATVFRALKSLEEDDVIQRRERRRANGSRKSNAYRINLELLAMRKRKVEPDEEDELAAYFEDDSLDSASSHIETMHDLAEAEETKGQVAAWSQPETLDTAWSQGETGGGLTVRPLEPSVEPSLKEPPQPPRFAEGPADPASLTDDALGALDVMSRCACGKRVCRTCGFNTTRASRAEREATEHARAEHEERGKWCGMCRRHGTDANGWTFWQRVTPGSPEPLLPITKCDHETPHHVVVKILDEAEATRERLAAQLAADRQRALAERREQALRRTSGGGRA
jgi:hypothetical protein